MKILCMPQAFKACLPAPDAAMAIARAARKVLPDASVLELPMADGGDDTLDVLLKATSGQSVEAQVTDPLGRRKRARWGVMGDGRTAVIEMAQASGLRLLQAHERDPRVTTTKGTGELIRAALDAGHEEILVGVGGSATVDGGSGALKALGVRFLDAGGAELALGGAALVRLASVDTSGLDRRLMKAHVRVACDVNMTLCGSQGAWRFATQKGADQQASALLEKAMERFAEVTLQVTGVNLRYLPFGGPAGGLAGGLHAYLGASLESGADLVVSVAGLRRHIIEADLVITGEGMIDANTFLGKGSGVIVETARAAGVPVIAVVGQIEPHQSDLRERGIYEIETLMSYVTSEDEACRRSPELITTATTAALKRFLAKRGTQR